MYLAIFRYTGSEGSSYTVRKHHGSIVKAKDSGEFWVKILSGEYAGCEDLKHMFKILKRRE